MRILLVGADSNYAIEKPYLEYLSKASEVTHAELYSAQNIFLKFYNKNLLNKILYRLGFSKILDIINNQIISRVIAVHPDILLVFKGMELYPGTIRRIKLMGIKVVNYNPDNPFIFTGRGSGNINITKSVGLYNLHLTYNMEVKRQIETQYDIPVGLLPFGYNISNEVYDACVKQDELLKLCFLGNPDQERANFIMGLAKRGLSIDVYGNHWEKWISDPKIEIHSPVYGDNLWKTLRKYRVQLNLMRIHNLNSHNMRSFEIPGVGGIMVAPKTLEHEIYFKNGKEVFLFSSIDECTQIVNMLLNLPAREADEIRKAARIRSIESGYSYFDRSKQLLMELKKL